MKASDEIIGVLILIAVLVFAAHAGGGSASSTTSTPESQATAQATATATTTIPPTENKPPVKTTTPASTTNIPGGPFASCPGWVIGHGTGGHDVEAVTLKVYYSPVAGGRNCAIAFKGGGHVGDDSTLSVSLNFSSYSGTSWPSYAYHSTNRPASRTGAVYLDDTNKRCIDASAIYRPEPGSKPRIVHVRKIGCR
jgi:hypothetical protein